MSILHKKKVQVKTSKKICGIGLEPDKHMSRKRASCGRDSAQDSMQCKLLENIIALFCGGFKLQLQLQFVHISRYCRKLWINVADRTTIVVTQTNQNP